jgi:hypothetical protein
MAPFMPTRYIFTRRTSAGKTFPENNREDFNKEIATGSIHGIESKQ